MQTPHCKRVSFALPAQLAAALEDSQKAHTQVNKAKMVLATSKKATVGAEAAAAAAALRAQEAEEGREAATREAATAHEAVGRLEEQLRALEQQLEAVQGAYWPEYVESVEFMVGHGWLLCGCKEF